MKIRLRKPYIILLAALVLEVCSLVNNIPSFDATNNQTSPAFVLSRDFSHRRLPIQHIIRQPQVTTTNTVLPANTQGSQNWAGYIVTPSSSGSSYSSVSGSWTVPAISNGQQNGAAAQWIGLGGVSSTDLLQMGTIEQIENGQPVAEVFWEKLPSPAQYVMTVPIGSTINASISPSADLNSTWNLTFTVNGQPQTQTISPVTLDSSYAQGIGTSAEWISEDPSNENNELYPLANMGTVSYKSAMVNDQALDYTGNQVQPVAMVSNNGNVLIAPSELGTDGQSFSTNVMSTNTSTNTSPSQRYGQNGTRWSHSAWIITNGQGYQDNNDDSYGWTWTWNW